ncbi:pentapeptide repeat protein [Clostridium puniceum]|uniref:Pentapeptide repeat protein n=1 Tax=Clostridium puniceum TaxID=29367 RepID=A0A1S8TKS3_9CLOT|nr:pentapeptide repeat-containing protein [Clostridium puniceum]OOM78321.1 pentapeptide repeat protein [Clostridium puniceum]
MSKKNIFLLLLFTIICFSLFTRSVVLANTENTISTEQGNLNLQEIKTRLEIEKLSTDIKNSNNSIVFQYITLACTAVTVIISLRTMSNQINTFRMQTEQNKKQQMTSFLSQLASSDEPTKVGAIQALGKYEEALPYLVNLLKFKTSYFVADTVMVTLINNAEKSLKLLIDESKSAKLEKIKLAGELTALDEKEDEIIKLLDIDIEVFKEWKESELFKDSKDRITYNIELQCKNGESSRAEIISIEKKKIITNVELVDNLLKELVKITSGIIKKLSQLEKKFSIEGAYLPKISLYELNLSEWNLYKADLSNANLKKCIFINTKFENAILKNTSFREGIFENNKFCGNIYDNCDFSKCKLENVEFSNIETLGVLFKGAVLRKCRFINCVYKLSRMEGINLTEAKIKDTKFYEANFMNAEIDNRNIFERVDFNGSRFDGSKNIRSKFSECKMFGVNFNNASYKSCRLNSVEFKDIKECNNLICENNKYHLIKFQDGCEYLKQYIEECNDISNITFGD